MRFVYNISTISETFNTILLTIRKCGHSIQYFYFKNPVGATCFCILKKHHALKPSKIISENLILSASSTSKTFPLTFPNICHIFLWISFFEIYRKIILPMLRCARISLFHSSLLNIKSA